MAKITCTMLVDDDPTTNFINEMLFDELKVTDDLVIANNGFEAIELIKKRREENSSCPEFILLDINMPVMDGFEFLNELNKLKLEDEFAPVIVMLTTSLNPRDVEKSKEYNISGFLNKPLSEGALKKVVGNYFSQKSIPEQ